VLSGACGEEAEHVAAEIGQAPQKGQS
jgi:hypothetical protein